MTEKLKRAVIKEELVALTGDFTKAVLLNQFIYWSERVKDFDKFIEEEKKRMETEGEQINIKKQNGWIYKTSEDLSEETMLGLSPQTIRRHLKELIDNNWLDERENPNYKWDRTKQYRVNISKIQKDLQKLGYSLEGYPLELEGTNLGCRGDNSGDTNFQNGKSKIPKRKIKDTKTENQSEQNGRAIPEITTEITTKTTTEKIMLQKNCNDNSTLKFAEDSTEITLARFMVNELLRIKPNSKVPNTDVKSLQNWAQHIDYMIRIDEREPKEIAELFRWAQEDDFWCANIRSPKKLREKWDTLELQRNRKKHKGNNNISKLERMYQEALREEYDV